MIDDLMRPPVPPPTLSSMLGWDPPVIPLVPILAAALALGYLAGLFRMHRAARRWPWMRTASFLSGCLLLAAVTGLAIEGYGYRLFSAFMFQHLTLSVLVPPLLVMGSPGRLLLRSIPHTGSGRLILVAALMGLRSRFSRFVLHPGVTIPLFLFSYYGLYLSDLFDAAAATWLGHTALELLFLCAGLLFIIPILSDGPLPVRQSNLGRLLDIFVEMPLHVFIGVILMMAPTPILKTFANPPADWAVDPLKDQAVAGGLAWSYGEPIALAIVLVFALRWHRDEEKVSAARDADVEQRDAELAAYNGFLQRLHASPSTPDTRR